jgi:hypothetical protein
VHRLRSLIEKTKAPQPSGRSYNVCDQRRARMPRVATLP